MAKTPKDDAGNRVLWIKCTSRGGPVWINTLRVRRIQYVEHSNYCEIVYNTKDKVRVDQTLEEVMEALGYKMPPKEPLETHTQELELKEVD